MYEKIEECINSINTYTSSVFLSSYCMVISSTIGKYLLFSASFLADPSTRLETNGDGELIPQRRERYVFRPILIRILESFFAQTPFPDLNRRIEIRNFAGVGLMPKEV
uniref:Uncharacterized protein n=1 Tax=Parascaris equorum TaxID=6256 RepID=A0A914R7X8_PAREQ